MMTKCRFLISTLLFLPIGFGCSAQQSQEASKSEVIAVKFQTKLGSVHFDSNFLDHDVPMNEPDMYQQIEIDAESNNPILVEGRQGSWSLNFSRKTEVSENIDEGVRVNIQRLARHHKILRHYWKNSPEDETGISLVAMTDLNADGILEYWAVYKTMYDQFGVLAISRNHEELHILASACPECAD